MKALPIAAITILLFGASARADYRDGLAALQRGDYAVAREEFLLLANEGHASAQYSLGFLYDYGEGVTQDYNEAAKWYRMAAEQGLARAQFSLGIMIESGTGVARDLARSYKWYSIAAETLATGRTRDTVIESRDLIESQLSETQRAAARKLIASYWMESPTETAGETPATAVRAPTRPVTIRPETSIITPPILFRVTRKDRRP